MSALVINSLPSRFDVFELNKKINVFKLAEAILKNYQKKMKEQAIEKRRLEEEARRRRIYEKYLLAYQRGSNFLRDFHTVRF